MASSAPSVSPRGIVVTVWLVLAACRGDGRTPVVLYSPHGRDQLTLLEQAFEAERPDIDVRWLDMGSQEILDRLRFERVNPQADVWFGGPTTTFDLGIEDSLLEPYRPSWADRAGPNGIGPRDRYYPVYRTPAVIAYNNRAVRPQEAPGDWDEVLQPRWCGKVIIRDPMASGTMRAIWGLILITSIRETGDTARGMDWLRRLDACTKTYTLNPAILDAKLARAEGLVTLWDPESESWRVVDTGETEVREGFRRRAAAFDAALERTLRESGADLLRLETAKSYAEPLLAFFRRRESLLWR